MSSLSSLQTHARTRTHTEASTSHMHSTVIIQRRHVQVAQERRQRRESKAWLKWGRMTAGAAIQCQGLTAVWTEATLTNWANLAAGEEKESQRTEWLLFSSSLSPHLNPLSPSPTLPFFVRSISISLSLYLTLIIALHLSIKPLQSHLKLPDSLGCPIHLRSVWNAPRTVSTEEWACSKDLPVLVYLFSSTCLSSEQSCQHAPQSSMMSERLAWHLVKHNTIRKSTNIQSHTPGKQHQVSHAKEKIICFVKVPQGSAKTIPLPVSIKHTVQAVHYSTTFGHTATLNVIHYGSSCGFWEGGFI